jgi:RNA polymerase sigma-70 factor (ECF subfamily)
VRDGGRAAGHRDAEIDVLAEAARGGEPRAVEDLLRALQGPVLGYCRARMGTHGLVQPEDVAQDVLYAACDALPRHDAATASFLRLVFGIAHNKVVDSYRAAGRDRSQPTDAPPERVDVDDGPELHALRTADTRRLRQALDQLPDHHREIIVLRVALRYSADEVARMHGTTAGAIRVTQFRAMKRLRTLLQDHRDHDARL